MCLPELVMDVVIVKGRRRRTVSTPLSAVRIHITGCDVFFLNDLWRKHRAQWTGSCGEGEIRRRRRLTESPMRTVDLKKKKNRLHDVFFLWQFYLLSFQWCCDVLKYQCLLWCHFQFKHKERKWSGQTAGRRGGVGLQAVPWNPLFPFVCDVVPLPSSLLRVVNVKTENKIGLVRAPSDRGQWKVALWHSIQSVLAQALTRNITVIYSQVIISAWGQLYTAVFTLYSTLSRAYKVFQDFIWLRINNNNKKKHFATASKC